MPLTAMALETNVLPSFFLLHLEAFLQTAQATVFCACAPAPAGCVYLHLPQGSTAFLTCQKSQEFLVALLVSGLKFEATGNGTE